MDAVTEFAVGLNIPLLTEASIIVHYYVYPLLFLLLAATLPFFNQKKKFLALILALFFIFFAFTFLKPYYHELRPCASADGIASKVPCPSEEYSFPSGHTGFAFVFAAATLGTTVFPLYFIVGVFTAFSRLYLGVHYFNDVIGGIVLGIVAYAIGEKIVNNLIRE